MRTGFELAVTGQLFAGLEDAARRALCDVVDEGIFAAGGQAAVFVHGRLAIDVAVGETANGRPLRSDDLHNVYCLVKPLPYLLLAHVLEGAGVGPDDQLEGAVSLPRWCPGGLTLRILASHQANLVEPSAMLWRMTPKARRAELLEQSAIDRTTSGTGAASGVVGYSELVGGLLCEAVIELLKGCPAGPYCSEELLEPLGLSDDVVVDAASALAAGERVQAPVSGLPVSRLPMLSEILPIHLGEIRLALGALATMRGAAGLMAAVGQVMAGVSQPGLPSPSLLRDLLHDDRPLVFDPVLQRPAKWAGGLMTDLNQQYISQIAGAGAVGHAGGLANSVALYDPARDASVAVYLNGVGSGFYDQALPRQQVVDEILDAAPST